MKNVRLSTIIFLCAIAGAVGALAVVALGTHRVPVFVTSAQAAAIDQGPFASFSPIVQHAAPAVVNISATHIMKARQQQTPDFFNDPMFRQFFGNRMPRQQAQPQEQRAQALGSGVVVSPDGYILTNNHVVEGASGVKVSFSDNREYTAKVIGTDPLFDIAVVKVERTGLATVPLADSSRSQVGDVVLAIGDPFGLGQTVTMGIVSAKGRSVGIERFDDFIQTDAAINHGNSGGALINTRGELIGINTAILPGETGGNVGVGFAIPTNLAKNAMDQIIKHGKAEHGFVGVLLEDLTPDKARAFGMPENAHGVIITQVEPNSPGASAGLQPGDVVTAMDGHPVNVLQDFRVQIAGMMPDTKIGLTVFRDGHTVNVPLTLGTMKADETDNGDQDNGENTPDNNGEKGALHGVSVQTITPDLRQQMQLPDETKGVIVTGLDQSSAAANAGVEQGDVIVQVNRRNVSNVQQFNDAVRAGTSGSTLLLVHKRTGAAMFLVIPNH